MAMPDPTDPQAWVTEAQENYRDAWEYPIADRDRPLLAASAAAQIAQAMVMVRDSEVMALEEQVVYQGGQTVFQENLQVMDLAQKMGQVEMILERARESGPRHPAIYEALEVLRG